MQEPIITFLTSQSTEAEKTIHQEDEVPDEAIMFGKQLKILISKMNSILYFLSDTTGKTSISGIEVEYFFF